MRPLIPLLLTVGALTSGCFVELRAGMTMVTGGNDPSWRPAPMVGISAGGALDVGAGRFSVGAGADGFKTPLMGKEQVAAAGPAEMRIDVRLGKISIDAVRDGLNGITFAGSFPYNDGSVVGRFTQVGDHWEARRYGMASLFFGGAHNRYLGLFPNPTYLDLAAGLVVPLAVNNEGITNLWGAGAQARITLSMPLLMADALAATQGIERASARSSWIQDYERRHPRPSQLGAAEKRIKAQGSYDQCITAAQQRTASRRLDDPTPDPGTSGCVNRSADVNAEMAGEEAAWQSDMLKAMEAAGIR